MSPIPGLRAVGLLGGGVIGGGWAARFLLNGVDVRLLDPDPEAPRKVGELLDNARRAVRRLTMAPLPPEGTLHLRRLGRGGGHRGRLRPGERAGAHGAQAVGAGRCQQGGRDRTS